MTQHNKHASVLVVGAGPTGLVMATMLLRQGISVRLIDRLPAPEPYSKAFVLHARTLEVFEHIGIIDEIVERGLRLNALQVYVHDKRLVSVGFSRLDAPYPFVLNVPQSEIERLLAVNLERLGGHIEREVELLQVTQRGNEVHSTLRRNNGQEETVTSQWVIGCDGAHSTIRHILQLPFTGAAHPEGFALADVYLQWSLPEDTLKFFFHNKGLFLAIPLPGGLHRLIVETTSNAETHQEHTPTLDDFQRYLQERGPHGATISQPVWMSLFRAHTRSVSRYRVGRVFLAGDAAHIHSPAAGQGMNTGIQDAYNLAWKLALVEKQRASPQLLDTYQEERAPVARSVIRLSDTILRMGTLRNPLGQYLRNHLAPHIFKQTFVQRQLLGNISQLALTYRNSSLTEAASHLVEGPKAGDRAPDSIVYSHQNIIPKRLFALLHATQYTLLFFRGKQPKKEFLELEQAFCRQVFAEYRDLLTLYIIQPQEREQPSQETGQVLYDVDGTLHERYGMHMPGIVLIRPDGYISLRARLEQSASLQSYLSRWFGPIKQGKENRV